MKKSFLTRVPGSSLVLNLPSPWNISYMWNLGRFLGMIFGVQLITGILLVFYYIPRELEAFNRVIFIIREVKFGFLLRFLHINGASFLFILIYSHIVKGLLNASFRLVSSWISGNLIFFLTILVAFIGYVLPWGNIGFWAATVITSFLSAIPYLGDLILKWIWGGYRIRGRTLQFFFTFHYLAPFVIATVAVVHIILLHTRGSSNPLGSHTPLLKIKFYPFFTSKDILNVSAFMLIAYLTLILPYWSRDPENFSYADRIASPLNIQPEWYFLPFYALLRRRNSKLGGLMLILIGIFIFWLLPSIASQDIKNFIVYYGNLWLLLFSTFLLGWIASWRADAFFSQWLKWFSIIYFSWWFIIWIIALVIVVAYS